MNEHSISHQQKNAFPTFTPVQGGLLQRKCACGGTPGLTGECEVCRKKREAVMLQRATNHTAVVNTVPPIIHEVLRSPGHPLDPASRALLEPRFGHDFSQVRVHADTRAAESAQAVNALAYTVGRDVVFAQDQYRPATTTGQHLLAHELTHVVQQYRASSGATASQLILDPPHSLAEQEAQRIGAEVAADNSAGARPSKTLQPVSTAIISRAAAHAPDAAPVTSALGQTVGAGLQFWPTNVTDTRVGPVSVQGGLLSDRASRLNVIIGDNLSIRTLARELLPLWLTATPFTPPGAATPLPLDLISEDELAQALLVYNQTYLPVPAMTNWRAGLRFPLPVEIEEATGIATLHPLQIRQLAGAFDPAWAPLLDQRATATTAPPVATLQADTAAFLARETTALARGIHLGARALTNAVSELPFIRETFRQLGAGAFEVALTFMDNLVNREISLLAAQRDGAAILAEIRTALAAAPATLTADQQASLARANLMLGLVAGVAAAAPPAATRSRAEKSVTIDTVKLDGSNRDPATDVALANAILTQCNVRLNHVADETATPTETTDWIGADQQVQTGNCNGPSADQRRLSQEANARFNLSSRIRVFYVASVSSGARAESCPPTGAGSLLRRVAWVTNSAAGRTLAHEVGHILLDPGPHRTGSVNLMAPTNTAPLGITLTNGQCTTIYTNA